MLVSNAYAFHRIFLRFALAPEISALNALPLPSLLHFLLARRFIAAAAAAAAAAADCCDVTLAVALRFLGVRGRFIIRCLTPLRDARRARNKDAMEEVLRH